jgi:hypothetical protein
MEGYGMSKGTSVIFRNGVGSGSSVCPVLSSPDRAPTSHINTGEEWREFMAKITIGLSDIDEETKTIVKVDFLPPDDGTVHLYFCDPTDNGVLVFAELTLFEARKLILLLQNSVKRVIGRGEI